MKSEDYMRTVRLLQECHAFCQKAFAVNAPKEAGMSLAYIHLKRMQACSEICESTARMLVKEGVGVERLCEICARICEQCARSCEQIDNAFLQRVAGICRQTARACLDESYRIKRQAA